MNKDKVYTLNHDYGHSGDPERDAFLVRYEGYINLPYYFIDPKSYPIAFLPSKIYFHANSDIIPLYDYPLTDLDIPVLSKRMLETLISIHDFEFTIVPALMIDDTYLNDIFNQQEVLKEDVPVISEYYAIRLESIYDGFFDFNKSDYKMSKSIEGQMGRIRKFVLKQPDKGFPAIFRISESPSTLFVSQEAKEAWEAAGIKGCVFEAIEVSN